MKCKFRWLFAFIFTVTHCFSQQNIDVSNFTKLTFLSPGISRELRVAKLQSIYLQAFMNTSAYFSYSSTFGTDGGVYFDPALTAQYRYYYNAVKRAAKGKRTELNSLNYIAGVLQTVFSDGAVSDGYLIQDKRRPVNSIGAVWGLQRNGQKHFSLDLNIGIGYLFAKGTKYDENWSTYSSPISEATVIGQLSLGFWLNKRK